MKAALGAFVLLSAATAAAQDDSLVSIGDRKYLADTWTDGHITVVRYPSLGCPEIVRAGARGRAILKLASAADAQVTIISTGDVPPTVRTLPVVSTSTDPDTNTTTVLFDVSAEVPEDTYDFRVVVPSQGVADEQPNCFKVVAEESTTFNFVVIADTQFNDPRGLLDPNNRNPGNYNALNIVSQIKRELKALNPTFAIFCGDLMFGLDYNYEYEGAWRLWKDTGVPIFMVPGNHDGYATLEDRTVLGVTARQRDGLDFWRKYIGPTYFSFDFGGLHFQGVNSYDGSAARRDSFFIVVENFGGDLTQEQMDWVAADVAGRPLVIPFMHHNPLGPYRDNGTFSLLWFIILRIIDFLTSGNFNDFDQVWNTQSTADFLKAQYTGKAPFIFIGHEHYDDIESYAGSTYKLVTTAGSGGSGYWGYAPIKVENGAIADWLYGGQQEQSLPAGNLHVSYNARSEAVVTSGLARPYDVTLEFVMPQAPAYAATNGEVLRAAPIGNGFNRVWVRATTPTSPSLDQPASKTVSLGGDGVALTGGGGCGSPGAPGNAAPLLAALAALAACRYLVRR